MLNDWLICKSGRKTLQGTLHSAVIALISAYDISNEKELLEIAEMILNKIYEVDSTIVYAHFNEWQIMKRKNILSEDEINKMKNLQKKCPKEKKRNLENSLFINMLNRCKYETICY